MSNRTYDILKALCTIWLPALATFIFALENIWHLGVPAEQIVGTITALCTLIGTIIGISSKSYKEVIE